MKGIIFQGNHVLRILDGKKTQTRRLLTLLRWADSYSEIKLDMGGLPMAISRTTGCLCVMAPRYHLGETLYCKETWCPRVDVDPRNDPEKAKRYVKYRSNGDRGFPLMEWHDYGPWRSPMMMPEWASRCHIKITSVKAQRLQDISEEDAIAEGIEITDPRQSAVTTVMRYRRLWDSTNPRHPWENNDWVWALTFARVWP